ncbi:radical SAM protein [Lentisphaerota bacterium ZTH]|nr:cobalamin-dependent protein [Lentisphaerota bacterium]WET05149.1 radical SAM protein [Lentisphaerota bacterium ZTH]
MKHDIVLINPGDRKQVFQSLGIDVAAIEPPFWIAVIAAYLRDKGFKVAIIDSNAENLTPAETAARTEELNPLLTAVIVYGSQPSASTQNMTVAGNICRELSKSGSFKVALGGLHPAALPEQTIREEAVDYVLDGEAILTLEALLSGLKNNNVVNEDIKGLWWRENGEIKNTERFPMIRDLDKYLPVGAWDLLPMHIYRAHNWHCFDDIEHRKPYGAIYTSLGCPFGCVFCCINAPFDKPAIRYRSPERVLDEIGLLVNEYGVKNLKIVDELFVLKKDHYMSICKGIIERGYDVNIWAYARVDTVHPENLAIMKQAGVNWLALGIESANPDVRDGAQKNMRVKEVKEIVKTIQDAGIRVIGNYIFGLPDDTVETMRETLDMAKELNCEFANFYSAMAYPGSKLYNIAVEEKWALPECWHGFSQHSYETLPLCNKNLTAAQVLKFRDDAFHEYFSNPVYLEMLEEKFGERVRKHIEEITSTRLQRKICSE